jgi:hypothetical protein
MNVARPAGGFKTCRALEVPLTRGVVLLYSFSFIFKGGLVMSGMLATGAAAPDFSLVSNSGETVTLSSHRGKENVVLVFYPKNNTPG